MVIEFLGVPGAGKTTLMPVIIEHLKDKEGIQVFTFVQASRIYATRTIIGKFIARFAPQFLLSQFLWQTFCFYSLIFRLKFIFKNPKLIRIVLSTQLRRPLAAGVWNRRVLKWFFVLIGRYEFLTSKALPGEALIFDEGFIHRVVQMNASDVETPDLVKITTYINLLPSPDLVIIPQASLEVCESRVFQRGIWQHFKHKTPAEISRYLANSYQVVGMAAEYIKQKGWKVFEIENGGDELSTALTDLRNRLVEELVIS